MGFSFTFSVALESNLGSFSILSCACTKHGRHLFSGWLSQLLPTCCTWHQGVLEDDLEFIRTPVKNSSVVTKPSASNSCTWHRGVLEDDLEFTRTPAKTLPWWLKMCSVADTPTPTYSNVYSCCALSSSCSHACQVPAAISHATGMMFIYYPCYTCG